MFDDEFCQYIADINNKGWFDEFSNNHFLIKTLEGDINYFNKYKHLIKGSLYYSNNTDNAINFITNFSHKFQFFSRHFKEKQMEKFVKDQLSAGKKNYDESQFFRALSEINVINFLLTFGPARLKEAIYEPRLGKNGSNPEARLIYENGITVDVEVKTPGFNIKEPKNLNTKEIVFPYILLEEKERTYIQQLCDKNKFEFILPRVNKLKDFINSAGKKFVKPKNKNYINLLFINWTYTEVKRRGYMEPYSLLYNNLNGLLKNKEAALSIGIDEDALEKITAIIVYQDSFDSIIFGDMRHIWNGYNFRMLPNHMLNKALLDMDILRDITKMNQPNNNDELIPYEIEVKSENLYKILKITDYINNLIKNKMDDKNDNITYFNLDYLNKKLEKDREKLEKMRQLEKQGFRFNYRDIDF